MNKNYMVEIMNPAGRVVAATEYLEYREARGVAGNMVGRISTGQRVIVREPDGRISFSRVAK